MKVKAQGLCVVAGLHDCATRRGAGKDGQLADGKDDHEPHKACAACWGDPKGRHNCQKAHHCTDACTHATVRLVMLGRGGGVRGSVGVTGEVADKLNKAEHDHCCIQKAARMLSSQFCIPGLAMGSCHTGRT